MDDVIRKNALINAVSHKGAATAGPVISKIMGEFPEARKNAKDLMPKVQAIVDEVNAMGYEAQKAMLEQMGGDDHQKKAQVKKRLPELEGAQNGLVMRFAPGPSGPLHIGHSRACILNDEYCKLFNGKFILRFEDTNPEKIELDAYKMIPEDLDWLGIKVHETFIQSDRMDIYYEHARKLLEMGHAYICKCDVEVWRELKLKQTPCPHRDLEPSIQLEEWDRLLSGHYTQGEASFMVKTDLHHNNPAVRDFVGMRVMTDPPHPRHGSKYIVYPLYNYSVAIDDHLMGCTHVLRGKDHLNNTFRQEYVYDHFGWKRPLFYHYGFVSIDDVILKKSKIKEAIHSGYFGGWDDVRLGTFRALKRRGISPDALREYWVNVGLKQVDIKFAFENLYSYNKAIIDPVSSRYFFVSEPQTVVVETDVAIEGRAPKLPDNKEKGYREYRLEPKDHAVELLARKGDLADLTPGQIFRFKDLCNVSLKEAAANGVKAKYEGNDIKVARSGAKIIQWVPKEGSIPTELVLPTGEIIHGFAEKAVFDEPLEIVQFERVGFVRIEDRTPQLIKAVYTQN